MSTEEREPTPEELATANDQDFSPDSPDVTGVYLMKRKGSPPSTAHRVEIYDDGLGLRIIAVHGFILGGPKRVIDVAPGVVWQEEAEVPEEPVRSRDCQHSDVAEIVTMSTT